MATRVIQNANMEKETTVLPRASVFRLFRALTSDLRTLLRQELQLAKTEVSEKLAKLGRNAAALAAGGAVAYAGLIVFLFGLGWLLAWALSLTGMSPIFAAFLGLGIVGLLATAIGCALLLHGLSTLSHESLAPERTLHTLQELKGTRSVAQPAFPNEAAGKASSAEMQARVERTENRVGETLEALGQRLSPQHINEELKHRIQANPYRAGLFAMLAGVASGLLLRRRPRHAS